MMRRRYKAEHYRELVVRIKASMPHAAIGVDVIVGFPGETDTHFEETFQFLHELPVSYLHVFSYSERENTPAAEYSAQGLKVPMHVRAERSKRLRTLSAKKKRAFYSSQLSSVRTVIPETRNEEGRWVGWTENYVRVECVAATTQPTESAPILVQMPIQVRLRELGESGETVIADVIQACSHQPSEVPMPTYIPILM
jgi:threonylcarbamoyladenosine tRNA methylthiotransferase MtaB